MTPAQAGWQVIGADGPTLCPGSGQLLMAPGVPGAYYPCPVCAEYVRTDADGAALTDHEPPAGEAPTISLGL